MIKQLVGVALLLNQERNHAPGKAELAADRRTGGASNNRHIGRYLEIIRAVFPDLVTVNR